MNTVFQDYALFPHMNVGDNVAYGLIDQEGARRSSASQRVAEALRMVRLEGYEDRRPGPALGRPAPAGGARTGARQSNPRVLLLDEPLGALDLKLRQEMQIELKTIQQEVGITFVYVTHDQDEALAMSDRMAIFNDGLIEQVGTPADVYESPTTAVRRGLRRGFEHPSRRTTAQAILGETGTYTVRPEKIHLGDRLTADGRTTR